MSSKKRKPRQRPADSARNTAPPVKKYGVHNAVVSYYLFLMLGLFILFLSRQNYSKARHDKFYLYLALSGILIVGAGVAYALYYAEQKRVHSKISPFFQPLTVTDGAFLCFTVFAYISTVVSEYTSVVWLADEHARNNGMLLLLVYIAVYFIVTRMYVYKDYVIAAFLISGCIVALLTALNFFYIDPLGLLERYDETIARDFGSTIGNKNFIASYMAMFLPVAVMTLALNKKLYMRIIAGVAVAFAYAGALCANSSSVLLGLFVTVPVMAIFCAQQYDRLTRFMLAMTILFAAGKGVRWFSYTQDGNNKGFESINEFLICDKLTYVPIAVCGAVALALFLLRGRLQPHYPAKAVTITLISLTGVGIFGMLGVLFYFSVIDTTADLGSMSKLLRYNDAWGTHRGFMWNRALEEYGKFDFINKLFGTGPDTVYYVLKPHFAELAKYGDGSTDTVHNEYLNYLITQGLLGMLSYLAIIGSVCVRAFRRAKNNPMVLVFISAVICYAVQGIVNISQPMTTPLFFLFLSMAEALNRQTPISHK